MQFCAIISVSLFSLWAALALILGDFNWISSVGTWGYCDRLCLTIWLAGCVALSALWSADYE